MNKKKEETSIAHFVKENFNYHDSLPFAVTRFKVPKNTYIISEGQHEDYLYFIVDGIVENGMNKNGENTILEFYLTNQFFTALIPILTRTKTDVYFLALTECTIEKVYYKELRDQTPTSLIVNRVLRHISEQALMQRIIKEKQLSSLNAEEMYLELIKTRPYLLHKIPIKRIAKYLGIHPQSLSRIRKQIGKKTP